MAKARQAKGFLFAGNEYTRMFLLSLSSTMTPPINKVPSENIVRDLDILLSALDLHPSNRRQSFKILRVNIREMKADGLSPAIVQLKERFAALDDETLRSAWHEFHNPFRDLDEVRH